MFVERDGELKKVCNCTHNTKGDDCEMCDDFHQDVPWTPWTWSNSFEIEASECKRKLFNRLIANFMLFF